MITRLRLHNFKAFAELDLHLGSYTLLSGLNSAGKSTVLQALALLHQTGAGGRRFVPQGAVPEGLPEVALILNGEFVALGTARDVLHEDWVENDGDLPTIGLGVEGADGTHYSCTTSYVPEADQLTLIESDPSYVAVDVPSSGPGIGDLFANRIQYLRADRINPAVTFPRSFEMSVGRGFLGTHGEYTTDYLRHYGDTAVTSPELLHPNTASPRLLDQVEAWMGEICPGARVVADALDQTDLVRLRFRFERAGEPLTGFRRPTNVGFGLTYVLPVVVACLSAEPGSLLMLENPEAHVHPRGQSAMGRLTCAATAAGAQVIVETHSDHVLNGVRLAVKRDQLPTDAVVLHYFQQTSRGINVVSPRIGPDGMLTQWPDGFFDEWDHTLDQLLG